MTKRSLMKNLSIKQVIYLAQYQELYVQFESIILPGYDTACFVEVPYGTAKRFKASDDRDIFFQSEIRTKYKYYATFIELARVKVPEQPIPHNPDIAKEYPDIINNYLESTAIE